MLRYIQNVITHEGHFILSGATTPAASVHSSDVEDEVDEEKELAELRIADK